MKGAEKNGPRELSIHQMSLMILPKPEDPVPSQVGREPKNASLVRSSVKFQGISYLNQQTNMFQTPKTLFFFFAFCVKMKCHWTLPIYKAHCALLTLPVYWPFSLPFFFSVVWNGSIRKKKSAIQAVSLFLPPIFYSPPGAVWMAELANSIPIGVFPDKGVILTQNSRRARFHAMGAIYKMGTFHAVVRALQRETACL